MVFKKTDLDNVYIIELDKIADERGFFARTFCDNEFHKHGIDHRIVQSNISFNKFKHTLRGMHYQAAPYEEAKLVQCIKGKIYDVIIDMRGDSATYQKWIGVELDEQNLCMLYVPKGFAHGFLTLEDETAVTYQVSEFYRPEAEKGIKYDDPLFNITWPAEVEIISDKDANWQLFEADYTVN